MTCITLIFVLQVLQGSKVSQQASCNSDQLWKLWDVRQGTKGRDFGIFGSCSESRQRFQSFPRPPNPSAEPAAASFPWRLERISPAIMLRSDDLRRLV